MKEIKVENAQKRIDKYLSEILDESRSVITKMIDEGFILVNNQKVKASKSLKENNLISIQDGFKIDCDIKPADIPLNIVFEDENVILINKQSGLTVHPGSGNYDNTMVNALMYYTNNLSDISGDERPGIVHRIDKDTTGALIICKNDYSHNFIAEQLKVHSITRKYVGIVQGVVKDESGTINAPIGRHPVNRKEMAINHKNGKEAVTHYKVLKRFDKYTFMEFQLETGRTHQIRVHMASIHHPLLGDTVYNHNKCPFKLEGQCLHAKTIGFIHPTTKEYVEFEAPIPEYMEHLLKIL